jgi:uncharacterized membrane protein
MVLLRPALCRRQRVFRRALPRSTGAGGGLGRFCAGLRRAGVLLGRALAGREESDAGAVRPRSLRAGSGRFSYGPKIGALLFNAVPWTVPFSWTPLLLWAFWLGRGRIFLVGALLLLGDLCLDPGAVAQAFWRYDAGGAYYGVPLSNFAGWVLSGTLGAYLGRKLLGNLEPPFGVATSGLLSLGFWCSVCGFMGLWIPMLVGLGLLGGSIFWSFRKKSTSSS